MSTPGKAAKKEKKKPIPVKTSLNNPYDLRWAPLEKGQKAFILNCLTETIEALGLKKIQVRVKGLRSSRRRKSKQRDSKPPEAEKTARQPGWSDEASRRQLAIGINEVTKGLEKDELSLVLVCSSIRPAHMISHLIPLSRTRAVPACQVPGLSEGLSGALGLSSVLALGFKRGDTAFSNTVGEIASKVPPLCVPWVPTEKEPARLEDQSLGGDPHPGPTDTGDLTGDPSDPVKTETQTEEPPSNPPRGQKRKLDLSHEPGQDPTPTLQPLKVKKTIPNPSKIRKPKKKKASAQK
ncbi:ribonuclease P protein subunit p38 [Astyanax mexicanus]|uniref:ribonuclease P protein subunit p38 n=1 Tax=Astyanax mexicanus TaxID=7994 RepID=UPI0003CD2546|nr:ribonuclease P protein subunit p38 [Astyanax mexicanus]